MSGLDVWLSRWHDGYYCVSFFRPKRSKIFGTNQESFYFATGDPVGHRYICPLSIKAMFEDDELRDTAMNMQPMDEPIHVTLFGKINKKPEGGE